MRKEKLSVQLNSNKINYNSSAFLQNKNRKSDKTIAFQGLNRYLTKKFPEIVLCRGICQHKEAKEIISEGIKKYPNSRRYIGTLPSEWINTLPKENKKESIQKIQDLFAGFAEKLYVSQYVPFKKDEKFVADFLSQLQQIINLKTNISYISSGRTAKGFKLKVGNKLYALKTYHSDMNPVYDLYHGKFQEPAGVPFARKKGCGAFTRFYFGKIGTEESKDAFILSEYQPHNQILTPAVEMKRLLKILKSPVTSYDVTIERYVLNDGNVIARKITDFGGLELLPLGVNMMLSRFAKDIGNYYFKTKKTKDGSNAIIKKINEIKPLITRFDIEEKISKNFQNILERVKDIIKINNLLVNSGSHSRKRNNIPNAGRICKQHNQPVNTYS